MKIVIEGTPEEVADAIKRLAGQPLSVPYPAAPGPVVAPIPMQPYIVEPTPFTPGYPWDRVWCVSEQMPLGWTPQSSC